MIVVEGVSSTIVELLVTAAAGELEETLISLDDWMESAGVPTLDTETNVLGDGELGLEIDTVGTELRIGTLDETGNTELGIDMAGSEVGREVGRDDGTERERGAGTDPGLELGLGLTTGNVVREELCPGTGPGLELGSETGGVSTGLGDGATTMGELVITCEVAGTDAEMLEFVNLKEDEGLKTPDAGDVEAEAVVAEVEEEDEGVDDELSVDETLEEVEVVLIVEEVLSLLISVALEMVDEVLEVEEVIVLLVTVELEELVALVDVGVDEDAVLDVLLLEEVVVTTVEELVRVLELLLELDDVVELPGEVEIGWLP
ncbi:hypothetical protein N0V92_007637 [Colletotrichum tropicale]|nr:hypothetical protein N0V92_007637 [Colletotrichum tropicale]